MSILSFAFHTRLSLRKPPEATALTACPLTAIATWQEEVQSGFRKFKLTASDKTAVTVKVAVLDSGRLVVCVSDRPRLFQFKVELPYSVLLWSLSLWLLLLSFCLVLFFFL